MKNKLFIPIIVVTLIIIFESVLLLTSNRGQKTKTTVVDNGTSRVVQVEDALSFEWQNKDNNKADLVMKANKNISIDAIDLYVAYKNTKVRSVNNLNELPKPTFSKISTEKSLVVMNYLIPEVDGFKLLKGQSVRIAEFDLIPNSTESVELSIDAKTQVVENATSKVIPFNSKSLIINGSL